ncbi:hypothetical protein [Methylobacterium dankookense]|nr:hypothetical protein [Methylobacterium dankookense]
MTVIDGQGIGRPTSGPSMEDAAASRADMSAMLARAAAGGQADVAFVAPLGFLHEGGVWTHLDVAVVSGGDPLQAKRARRSAGHAAGGELGAGSKRRDASDRCARRPWLLTFGAGRPHGPAASAKHCLQGRGTEAAARTLPVRVPLPGRSVKAAMDRGLPTLETLRIGILLAATFEVAAADPEAAAVELATMADLMSPASHPTDRALAGRLSDLADRLDDIERALGTPASPTASNRRDRGMRRIARPCRDAVPELPAASWPAGSASAAGRR